MDRRWDEIFPATQPECLWLRAESRPLAQEQNEVEKELEK
jgi:hypothetical protein